ncbi:Phosphatidylinositol 4,5-bisphosphate 3-kinase catalytic subunit delta isoform [Armadillidium vulgare]|nr:Phosphatidylinositol 4,5-bisphosphate 3-kinase catalytic subunit delta isoform [Armadillidium vulgare]
MSLIDYREGPRPLPRSSSKRFEMEKLLFSLSTSSVSIDFLMPNGIIITHEVSTTSPLSEIKAEVWEKASEYPLFGLLHDQNSYHFQCIQVTAENQELMDENQCLHEINLFINILKVVERIGNEEEKLINNQIGNLIGKVSSSGFKEFDALKNPEVNDFRWKMRNECDEVVREKK